MGVAAYAACSKGVPSLLAAAAYSWSKVVPSVGSSARPMSTPPPVTLFRDPALRPILGRENRITGFDKGKLAERRGRKASGLRSRGK